MTTPAAGAPTLPPDRPAGWIVLTASQRGAAHVAVQTQNQDSVAVERAGTAGVVAAVADGHGHSRHLRSARGSRLAVSIGCRVGQELADQLGQADDADDADPASRITGLLRSFLVPAVVQRWREAVLADVAADPFTDAEEGKRRSGDEPVVAYGSTLLLCIALGDWLVLAQIGDGDVVGVRLDGTPTLPIPADPQLDGLVTTSLCGPDAGGDFRIAVLNLTQAPLLAVLLATDGYGNAQVEQEWPSSFSKDLAWLLTRRDMRWLASQLPAWAARCASADGSADDTTIALLVAPAGQMAQGEVPPGRTDDPSAVPPDAGSEEITIPAEIRTDTVPTAQRAASRAEQAAVQTGVAEQFTTDREPPGSSAGSGVR
jgi:hypothetical protein